MSSSGTLARGNGIASVTHTGTGTYVVTTTTSDITGCAYLATGGETGTGAGSPTNVHVASTSGNDAAVTVTTQFISNNGGGPTPADEPFHLAVFC